MAQQLNIFLYQASIISFINARYNRMYIYWNAFIITGHNFLTKLFRLICRLNSVEYEIGFRLEGFFFSVFFFIIHLLPKLNRLHLRSYGRWSSLFLLYILAFQNIPKMYFSIKTSWTRVPHCRNFNDFNCFPRSLKSEGGVDLSGLTINSDRGGSHYICTVYNWIR